MKYYEQASQLLSQSPLPDNCPEQMEKLIAKAKGAEKQMIRVSLESMYEAATPEQFTKWSEEN